MNSCNSVIYASNIMLFIRYIRVLYQLRLIVLISSALKYGSPRITGSPRTVVNLSCLLGLKIKKYIGYYTIQHIKKDAFFESNL